MFNLCVKPLCIHNSLLKPHTGRAARIRKGKKTVAEDASRSKDIRRKK